MFDSASSETLTRRAALRRLGFIGGTAALSSFIPRAARAALPAATPSLTGAQLGFYRFRIGEFEALALSDGQFAMPVAQSPLGVGEPQADVESVLRSALLPTHEVKLPVTALLVRTRNDLVLVDAGCGALYGDLGGRLTRNLTTAGVQPAEVTAVVLTHLHGDHFGGLVQGDTGEAVFKNARYIISRREHDFWANNPSLSSSKLPPESQTQFIQGAQKAINTFKGKWDLIAEGDKLIDGVEFIDAPGHTPGHIAVAFTSGSEQLLNIADVVHHHVLSFERPEWLMRFDAEPELGVKTRKKILDRVAADRARIFGVHLPFPGLGRVRSASGKFEYVIEPWQPV
jgi:glyoxylase-like metal-dependent hydrolase (beta-lactamase superfamily II)